MIDTDDAELTAIRSSFCFVIARWRLTQSEVAMLLGGTTGSFPTGRVLPDNLDSAAERRLRLLVRLDKAFERICPDGDVATRMRDTRGAWGSVTTLESLADERVLCAVIGMAEEMIRRPGTVRSDPLGCMQ